MNTVTLFFLVAVFTACARADCGELDLSVALPEKKQAIEVSLRRNPFQAGADAEKPLPVLRDKDDPALRLPAVLSTHIRSVLRLPHPLVLIDAQVVQPGDEVKIGANPILPKYRVVLKSVDAERLVFQLTSTDPAQAGQVESVVPLPSIMCRG